MCTEIMLSAYIHLHLMSEGNTIFRRILLLLIHVEILKHQNDLLEDGKTKDTSIFKGTFFRT